MIKKLPIATYILSLLLSLTILLPSLIQIGHIFEEHKHISCKEVKTHLHEASVDCSICDFHFSSFDYGSTLVLEFTVTITIFTSEDNYTSSETTASQHLIFLRGPPAIS